MSDEIRPTASPAAPVRTSGAWTGVLVAAYGALATVAYGVLFFAILPVRSLLRAIALEIERQTHEQSAPFQGQEAVELVIASWDGAEAPLLVLAGGGVALALAVLLPALAVVAGRERWRRVTRAALVVRALHEAAAGAWVALVVIPIVPELTERVETVAREAAVASGRSYALSSLPGFLTGSGLTWGAWIGLAAHIALLVWLVTLLGRPAVRRWCSR